MKTTYYTLTRWNGGAMAAGFDSAAGGERRQAVVRQPRRRAQAVGGDNVIDLNAWRCANPELCREEAVDGRWYWDDGEQEDQEPVLPAPRARRDRRRTMCAAELAATLAVAAAALALMLRVLLF